MFGEERMWPRVVILLVHVSITFSHTIATPQVEGSFFRWPRPLGSVCPSVLWVWETGPEPPSAMSAWILRERNRRVDCFGIMMDIRFLRG